MAKKKDKILLLTPPGEKLYLRDYYCSSSSKANYYWHPIDLLIQSGILNKEFNIAVMDAQLMNLSFKNAIKNIIVLSPNVIFFLIGSASFFSDISFIKTIKEINKDITLIGSGDILRFESQKIIKEYNFIDAILLDFTTDGIIKYLKGEQSENIISKDNNYLNINNERNKYFSYPIPLYNLFPLTKYKIPFGKQIPYVSILTAYGCPFNCIYCNSGKLGFKLREIDNLLEELDFITNKLNIFKVFFRDMTFTANKSHLLSVCEAIRKYRLYWNCYSRIDTVDEESLFVMKKAGCYLIHFGIESGSEEILKKYKSSVTLKEIKENILLCKKFGIDTTGHFIIGFPEDTKNTLSETLNLALSLPLSGVSFNVATPRYGSEFREMCIQNELIPAETISIDNSSSYSVILNKDFSKIKKYILLKFYFRVSYIVEIIRRIKSIHDIKNVVTQFIIIIKNILK